VTNAPIVFTQPSLTGRELEYVRQSLASHKIAGDGPFTQRCHAHFQQHYGAPVLLTHSCTAALEMAAMLLVQPGDEVIMPSFTFVSTANAFVLRGAVPVFVDVRADTLNIDETQIEAAIGPKTRVVVPVHYAGVGCQMDVITALSAKHGLAVVEDAAQGYLANWKGKALGSFGALSAVSFHETKNVVAGEGGLLIVNEPSLAKRAHIIREKGTNRTEFLRGEADKYEWLDIGSSYLPSDILAAVLFAQIEQAKDITARRLALWHRYHALLEPLERAGQLRRPSVPHEAQHNGHIYYVIFDDAKCRDQVRAAFRTAGIQASTHYVPLHSSPAGRKFGRTASPMPVTDAIAGTLLRLPLHGDMTENDVERTVNLLKS
jgi:dTDP-4-amino-4,6-dideoxygalactose transaminase